MQMMTKMIMVMVIITETTYPAGGLSAWSFPELVNDDDDKDNDSYNNVGNNNNANIKFHLGGHCLAQSFLSGFIIDKDDGSVDDINDNDSRGVLTLDRVEQVYQW